MADNVVAKILIDKREYDRLLAIEKKFHNHPETTEQTLTNKAEESTASLQKGAGSSYLPVANFEEFADTLSKKISQQIIPEKIPVYREELEPATAGYLDYLQPQKAAQVVRQKGNLHQDVPNELVLANVRQKYRKKASILLEEIKKIPQDLDYDISGIVYVDGQSIPNASIFQLLPVTLYTLKRNIPGQLDWFNALVKFKLGRFITNPEKKKFLLPGKPHEKSQSDKWFFIGDT